MNEVFGIKTFTMEAQGRKLECMVQFDETQEKPLFVIETKEGETIITVDEDLEAIILQESLKGE
jgi:hypothetical protein